MKGVCLCWYDLCSCYLFCTSAHLGLIALIAIAVPVVIIVGVPLGIVIYKWHKPRSPVVVERQTTDSTSAMINLHRQPTKYIKELV